MDKELHVRVVTPDRTVFDRKARAVSFMGLDGSYGILPNHAPLLTATRPGIVTITHTDGSKEEMLVTDGFAEMRNNVLSLICEAGERVEEIDVERAKAAEERARQRIAEGPETPDGSLPRAEASLRRAMLRQLVGRRGRSQN